MTVCIAATSTIGDDPLLVQCTDLMGSTSETSAETSFKFHQLSSHFSALLAGPISGARELATVIGTVFRQQEPRTMPEALVQIRTGIGIFRSAYAEAHLQATLGISYEEFKAKGKTALPDDLFHSLAWDIRNYAPDIELLVTGFFGKLPAIFKVSWDRTSSDTKVWNCSDFGVIGSGTSLAESSLFNRNQDSTDGFAETVYNVFEAKRAAEKAPYVGKKLILIVRRADQPSQILMQEGIKFFDRQVARFGPRRLRLPAFPQDAFDTTDP
jgi:hypothetical protein